MQESSPETRQDIRTCRALMRGGSRTFFAASLLLPKRVYEPATALYAFCRLADDAIDDGACKDAALADLRSRLDRAYNATPLEIAADRAFAAAVIYHQMPRTLPEALLEGFEWDSQGRRYEDLASLHDYAARVAGTVGAMMAVLMGVRDRQALARACDLGVAMQLTNIARDVGEDARAGRLYLPLAWLREENIDAETWLANPIFTPAIGRVVRRLLEAAAFLYARARAGIAALPADCRPGIRAAGLIYAAIGNEIAAAGFDSVTHRAHVPGAQKIALILRSLAAMLPGKTTLLAPALAATRYLVEAAAFDPSPLPESIAQYGRLEARVHWVFDLFERLDERRLETT
jgi:phytoene synthase